MLACVTAVPGAALSLPPLAFVCPVPQAQERGRPEKGVGGQRRRRRGAGGALSPLPTDAASREPDSGGRQLSRFLIYLPLPGWGRGSGWSGAFVSGFGSARVPHLPQGGKKQKRAGRRFCGFTRGGRRSGWGSCLHPNWSSLGRTDPFPPSRKCHLHCFCLRLGPDEALVGLPPGTGAPETGEGTVCGGVEVPPQSL